MPDPESGNRHDSIDAILPPGTARLMAIALGIVMVIWAVTWFPFDFRRSDSSAWLAIQPSTALFVIGNIALFMPLGFMEGWLAHNLFRNNAAVVILVMLDVAIASGIGETVQMWLPHRTSSMIDLVANTVGGTMGAMLSIRMTPALNQRFIKPD